MYRFIKYFLKSFSIFNKNIKFKHLNVQYLLKRRNFYILRAKYIFFRAIPAIKKIAKKVNKITNYDHYENMPFEHPLRFALRNLPIKTINVGYFHSLVSNNFFVYSHNRKEWRNKIKPDYIICTGRLSKKYLERNRTPSKKILIASALRAKNYKGKF